MTEPRHAFGPFVLEPAAGILRRDGVAVAIGQRGLALLDSLLAAAGEPVGKDDLMAAAWPGLFVEEANLSVQIAALRKALGKAPDGQEWIATVPRVGYRLPRGPALADSTPRPTRPSIAVLPFDSLPEDEYFADGMVEDIITALSRFKTFAVAARNAAFPFKGRTDTRAVATALGVRYLLVGTIRRRADRLRVSVQLVDADTATQLWAEQFDGEPSKLFEFQDSITESVVGLVEPEVRRAEIERARRKPPGRLDAYDLYLRALPLFRGTSPAVRTEAIRLLEAAVELDPGFAIAAVHAAWAYERQDVFGGGMTQAERHRAIELAELALDAGHDDPLVVAIAALVFLNVAKEANRSLAMLRQALAANPNNSTILSFNAFSNVMVGDLEFGRQCFLRALHVAPGALDNYELLLGMGVAHLFKGEFEASLDWSLQALATNSEWLPTYWHIAAAYAHLDRMDEARATIATLLAKAPMMRMGDIERIASRFGPRLVALVDGMRKAGLPA
ncbi:winged helix-turn-helix domain-containing protein [Devosia sp.]|uniref:winged helix-turn-helix domain-containing protein n=1 Tax=Devosia sp. TaxID=1871048 RepID=UPI003BA93C8A